MRTAINQSDGVPFSPVTPYSNGGPCDPLFNGNNRSTLFNYDASGQQQGYGGQTLSYDAEGRQTQATGNGSTTNWRYDAEGRRVTGQITGGETRVYVYDAFGQLAAEYRDQPAVAAPCNICYLATDYLGTTMLITDENGTPVGRHDFLPFGEELPANTAGRDGSFASADGVHQRYTGQERDGETLDFFQARYYASTEMRFLSPDPGKAGASEADPLSWNGYGYVNNNPLNGVDPTGQTTCDSNGNNCNDEIQVNSGPDPWPSPSYFPLFWPHCWSGNVAICNWIPGYDRTYTGGSPTQPQQPAPPPPEKDKTKPPKTGVAMRK